MSDIMDAAAEPVSLDHLNIKLDRMRGFGIIYPAEQMLCADGNKAMAVAMSEDRPAVWHAFQSTIVDPRTAVYKARHFEQDGLSFDSAGDLIIETLDARGLAHAKKMEGERHALVSAKIAYNDAMIAQGLRPSQFVGFDDKSATPARLTPSDVVTNPNDGPVNDDGSSKGIVNDFDLIGWAQGKVSTQFFMVTKAMREQHGVALSTKPAIIEWLIEHGKVRAEDVKAI